MRKWNTHITSVFSLGFAAKVHSGALDILYIEVVMMMSISPAHTVWGVWWGVCNRKGRACEEMSRMLKCTCGLERALFPSQRSQRNTDTRANTSASVHCKLECMFNWRKAKPNTGNKYLIPCNTFITLLNRWNLLIDSFTLRRKLSAARLWLTWMRWEHSRHQWRAWYGSQLQETNTTLKRLHQSLSLLANNQSVYRTLDSTLSNSKPWLNQLSDDDWTKCN